MHCSFNEAEMFVTCQINIRCQITYPDDFIKNRIRCFVYDQIPEAPQRQRHLLWSLKQPEVPFGYDVLNEYPFVYAGT